MNNFTISMLKYVFLLTKCLRQKQFSQSKWLMIRVRMIVNWQFEQTNFLITKKTEKHIVIWHSMYKYWLELVKIISEKIQCLSFICFSVSLKGMFLT